MAQADAKIVSGGAEPSAEMREVMAIEVRLREGKLVPTTMPEERALRIGIASYWTEGAPVPLQTTDVSVPGEAGPIRARVYRPTRNDNAPMVLLIHGGGWAFGSIEEVEPTALHLAAASGAVVVSTSYRLAPEAPYPAGLKDCEATLRWMQKEGRTYGGDPTRLAVGGASAGGNLAAVIAMRASSGTFKAQLLFYGVLGNSFETASYHQFADGRFGLPRERMQYYFDLYLGKDADFNDPTITPMNGDLKSVPPAWICAAECDVLHDDSVQFYEKLRALREGDQFVLAKGLNHGFVNRVRHLPLAKTIIESAAAFVKAKV
jgi:acetyl esterase